jgi:hypothetical protein
MPHVTMPPLSPLFLVTLFCGTVLAIVLAFEAGRWFGRWRARLPDPEPQMAVRALVASILNLLAFILGFTFSLASTHTDARSQSAIDEAIALRTAYRHTDLLPGAERTTVRALLEEYVDLRLEVSDPDGAALTITRLRSLQDEIWSHALAADRDRAGVHSIAPLTQSLVDVFRLGDRILVGVRSRISERIWLALYVVTLVSVGAAGYLFGIAGSHKSFTVLAYACVFALVVLMIAEGDAPGSTQFSTSQQALRELQAQWEEP